METDLLLDPDQPDEVSTAVAELLLDRSQTADPWWRAGLREALADPFEPLVDR